MVPEIILTEMDSIGKIGLINPFATILLFNDNVHGDALAEIVHDQPGKDFCFAAESFFVCKLDNPMAYFSSRKEVSIPQRIW